MSPIDGLLRSAACGAASGGRTFTGIAVLAASSSADEPDVVNHNLARPVVRVGLAIAALGELVGDKLPQAPSRLTAPAVRGRLVFGGLCGMVVARRGHQVLAATDVASDETHGRTIACAAVGAVSALAGAWLGVQWRAFAAPRPKRQRQRAFGAALVEDVTVVALAVAGSHRGS